MQKNIGTIDRLFRLMIGIALAAYGLWQGSITALLLSVFVFFEVFSSWCAFYHLIGKDTCPLKQSVDHPYNSTRLDAYSLGLAGGVLLGLSLFFWTIAALYTGWGTDWLNSLSSLYPGHKISWEGGIIGLIDGGIVGFFIFFILAKLYNIFER